MERDEGKTGDRVRLTAGKPVYGLKAGAIGIMEENNDGAPFVKFDDGKIHAVNYKHLELVRAADWRPEVGDRVTTNGSTSVNIEQHWNTNFRRAAGDIIDGALVVSSIAAHAGGNVGLSNKVGKSYFYMPANTLKPAPFRIEAGRYYKTRDGLKVGPMEVWKDLWEADIGGHSKLFENDGRHRFKNRDLDLISLWQEPATPPVNVAATVDYQADEYGSGAKVVDIAARRASFDVGNLDIGVGWKEVPIAKFKVGDRVQYVDRQYGFATVVGVQVDGRVKVKTSGWGICTERPESLELAPAPWSGYGTTSAIVALIEDGKPKPNSRPFVHATLASADTEAKRLAGVHKGSKFGVYVLTGEPAFVEREYKFTWQKMAARNDVPAAADELSRAAGIARSDAHFAVRNWLAAA